MQSVSKTEIRGKVIFVDLKVINSSTVANMIVVTEHLYSSGGEAKKETTRHKVEAWENTQVKDLSKIRTGSWVRVIGSYREKKYDAVDEDGKTVKKSSVFLSADYVKILTDFNAEYLNKTEIVGRVANVELRIVNNHTVGNVTVVTDQIVYRDKKSVVENTYHRVVAWANTRIKDLSKVNQGTTVKVVGRYRQRDYVNKQGKEVNVMEICADQFKKIAE